MTSDRPGYSIDQFRDPEAEVARLQRQASVVAQAELSAFRALGLPERGRVLDVGCGPGFVAARIQASFPGLSVVGVDRDPRMLELASGIDTVECDAAQLPFDSGSFDFAYARLVLRHVPRPEQVLAEMARVVRSGGGVVAADSDDDALLLDPPPDGFTEVLRARQAMFARLGADPRIGRRLVGLLRRAGLADVRVAPVVVTSTEIGPDAFATIVLSPIADGITEDILAIREVEVAAAGVREWGQRTDVFGVTTAFIAGGRKG